MNNCKKRMLAGLLAVITLFLSLPIPASAQELQSFSSGERSAIASNEGVKPAEILNVQMPVVRAAEGGFGQFDFVIDPVGLIRSTAGKRFALALGVTGVGIGSGNLFFVRHAVDENGNPFYSLTRNSDSLTIVNKSTTAVDVELSFEAKKKDTSDRFAIDFVDNNLFVDEDGEPLSNPSLCLAIKTGRRVAPVEAVTGEDGKISYKGTLKGWIPKPNNLEKVFETVWKSDDSVYAQQQRENVTDEDFNKLSFYMTGAINADNPKWEDASLNVDMSVVWTVKKQAASAFTEDPYIENLDPLVEVEVAPVDPDDQTALLIDYGSGTKAMTHVDKILYTDANGEEAEFTDLAVNATQVAFEAGEAILTGSNWKLHFTGSDDAEIAIPFNLREADEPDIALPDAMDPAVMRATPAGASGGTAALIVSWGFGSKAMTTVSKVTYTTTKGTAATLSGNAISINERAVHITVPKTAASGKNFVLVFSNPATGETFELPYDLIDRDPANPSVASVTKAKAPEDKAVVKFNWGSGSLAMTNVDKVTYTKADNTAGTLNGEALSVSGVTAEVIISESAFYGRDFKLVFSNSMNERTFELPVDLVQLPDPVDPYVTNVVKATGPDGDAVVTLNWGAGLKAMTTVTDVKYTTESGESATLGASAISIDGNTVTVTLSEDAYYGSEYVFTFRNARTDDTFELPVELAQKADPVDPTVVSVVKAEAPDGNAVVTLDWGAGTKAMNALTEVQYVTEVGESATLSESAVSVNGNTVTVTLSEAAYYGDEYVFVFSNTRNGKTFELPVELAQKTDPVDPSIVSVTKADEPGSSALVMVDWGTGTKAMTTVSEVKYTTEAGGSATLSGSAISVRGAAITIAVSESAYNGSDYVLVFSNSRNGKTFELPINLTTAQSGSVPGLTVTQAAASSGGTVQFSVDLGSYTDLKVAYLLYQMSGKMIDSTAGIQGTDLSNLSVTASKAIFNGSKWRVLLQSDDGKQAATIPINLKETGTSSGVVATLLEAATSQGSAAKLWVDLGDGIYTQVNHIVYFMSGKTADSTASADGSDLSAVTVTASKAIYNGSNWRLVASDESGQNELTVPFNLKG